MTGALHEQLGVDRADAAAGVVDAVAADGAVADRGGAAIQHHPGAQAGGVVEQIHLAQGEAGVCGLAAHRAAVGVADEVPPARPAGHAQALDGDLEVVGADLQHRALAPGVEDRLGRPVQPADGDVALGQEPDRPGARAQLQGAQVGQDHRLVQRAVEQDVGPVAPVAAEVNPGGAAGLVLGAAVAVVVDVVAQLVSAGVGLSVEVVAVAPGEHLAEAGGAGLVRGAVVAVAVVVRVGVHRGARARAVALVHHAVAVVVGAVAQLGQARAPRRRCCRRSLPPERPLRCRARRPRAARRGCRRSRPRRCPGTPAPARPRPPHRRSRCRSRRTARRRWGRWPGLPRRSRCCRGGRPRPRPAPGPRRHRPRPAAAAAERGGLGTRACHTIASSSRGPPRIREATQVRSVVQHPHPKRGLSRGSCRHRSSALEAPDGDVSESGAGASPGDDPPAL